MKIFKDRGLTLEASLSNSQGEVRPYVVRTQTKYLFFIHFFIMITSKLKNNNKASQKINGVPILTIFFLL